MEGPQLWEAISHQIEKMIRENIESTDALKTVVFKVGKDFGAEDLQVLRDAIKDCLDMQRGMLYMLFLISDSMKKSPELTLTPEKQKQNIPRT